MKRVLLASAGALTLAVLASPAGAADLPRRYVPPAPPAPAYTSPVYNWTGFYIGVNGGGGWGRSRWDTASGFDTSGWLVGGTAGYNWQFGQTVLGIEGDIDWTNIKGSGTAGASTKDSWLSTVRGRLGYAFDRFLPYVTGGLAIGDMSATIPGYSGRDHTNTGWTVGGGMEFALGGNWTAKAEYLYVDLGKFDCGWNCGSTSSNNVDFRTNIVRGGLNYRF